MRRIGCGFGQGYLFSRLVSADEARGWFAPVSATRSEAIATA